MTDTGKLLVGIAAFVVTIAILSALLDDGKTECNVSGYTSRGDLIFTCEESGK